MPGVEYDPRKMIGKTLAHYRVTAKLGEGGMGEVYQAQDSKLGRDVALKILPEAFTVDAERLARFEREARVLAALNHPNVAAIYSFETATTPEAGGEFSFLVMELAGGETLAARIARGPIPVDEVLPIAKQVAQALEAAHEKGIIHRDLKPANVVLDEAGKVKVLDFGLAKALDPMAASGERQDPSQSPISMSPTLTAAMTGANVLLGTAAYMSPEQAKGKAVDKRSDIWAFGVLIWEMLHGQRLFAGDSITDTLADVLRTDIDLETVSQRAPAPLIEVLRRCLERDPDRRLHDIADARLVIEDLQSGEWEMPVAATETATRSRGFPLGLAAGAVAGLIVGALLAGLLFRPSQPAADPESWRFEIAIPDAVISRPALSPDGRTIAYVSAGQLWVREFERLESRLVTGGEGANTPFWSPDGRSLGFNAEGALWRVPLEGGTRELIANRSTGSAGAAVWLPDDRIVFNTGNTPVFEVSARGGEPKTLVELQEGEVDFHDLVALPDGRGFLTVVHKLEDQAFDNVTWIDGEDRKELVQIPEEWVLSPLYSETGHILYITEGPTGNGLWAVDFSLEDLEVRGEPFLVERGVRSAGVIGQTLLYAPNSAVFTNEVVWVDRSGKIVGTIGEATQGLYPGTVISPDGRRAAITIYERQGKGLWLMDLETGETDRFVFEEDSIITFSAWTPDGSRIAYAVTTGGDDLRIMVKDADSGADAELVTEGSLLMSFSPDGRYMVFVRPRPGFMNDLWVRDLETGEESIFAQTDSWDILPAFSPVGGFVAHESEEEVFVTRFPEGEPRWQISEGGGTVPQWSADGRRLFFLNGDDLYEVAVEYDGRFRASSPEHLFSFTLAPAEYGWMRGSFSVDGNGERFLMVRVSGIPPGIVVHQNWLHGLDR